MSDDKARQMYAEMGVVPVINASGGKLTMLGGQVLSPRVVEAMEQASHHFVDMKALLARTGEMVAELIGAEAAYVTSGCCAAMALGTAACMAGKDPEKAARLPDTTGMPNQVIIQGTQRYKYERCVTVPGAQLLQVGDASGVRPEQIEAAIGEKTAAILAVASRMGEGTVPLEEVLAIGKRHDVPVIVDAAGQVYPTDKLKLFPRMGADLVAHSSKYFGGPNSAGFLCGRRDLVDAATYHSFISFEYGPPYTVGRPMKLDRQEVIALVEALREWLTMDHEARFAGYKVQAEKLYSLLADIPGIEAELDGEPVTGVRIRIDGERIEKTVRDIAYELHSGTPSVWLHWSMDVYLQAQPEGTMGFSVMSLVEGDEERLAERVREVVAG